MKSLGLDAEAVVRLFVDLSQDFGTRSRADFLGTALERVITLLHFDCGVARILDPTTGGLVLEAARGVTPHLERAAAPTASLDDALSGLSLQHRVLMVVEDLMDSPYRESAGAQLGVRTFVSVPLLCRGMMLGCLNFGSIRREAPDQEARELLSALGSQIGMSLANAELFSATQQRIQNLSALSQCSQDIGPAPELGHVLKLTAERMAQLLNLKRTAVVFRMPESQDLVGVAGHGFHEEALQLLRTELEYDSSLPIPNTAWLSEDPVGENVLPPAFLQREGVSHVLAAPLTARDVSLGLLIGDRGDEPMIISPDEMDLGMIFANQASIWLENARLFVREHAARAAAEASEQQFRELLELAPDGIVIIDQEGCIALVNSEAERMFGYSRAELTGAAVETLLPDAVRAAHVRHRTGYLQDPRTRPMGTGLDLFARRKDGVEFPVEISLSPTLNGGDNAVISVIRDISERREAEQERRRLLESERRKGEQLKLAVREAHHRIKNNLQAISDLLYLELASQTGESGETLLRESVERIQSIALVHDLLTQDEDVQTVDVSILAERLIPMVLRGASNVRINQELAVVSAPLSSKKATTVALILNELVSNALKHAFIGRSEGRLRVTLEEADEGLRIRVRDDGPGLPAEFDLMRDAHVGLQVVRTLAERDLGGKLWLESDGGVAATVWFPW